MKIQNQAYNQISIEHIKGIWQQNLKLDVADKPKSNFISRQYVERVVDAPNLCIDNISRVLQRKRIQQILRLRILFLLEIISDPLKSRSEIQQ